MSVGRKQILWLTFIFGIQAVFAIHSINGGGWFYKILFVVFSFIFIFTAGKMASDSEVVE